MELTKKQTLKKPTVTILSLFISTSISLGQNNNEIQKKVINTFEKGLQNGNYTLFQDLLSAEFTMGSYGQPLINEVIPQILAQHPRLDSLRISDLSNNIASIEYYFSGMEKQVSGVHFSSEGKITRIELFDAILNVSATSQNTNDAELIGSFTTIFELVNNLIFVKVNLNGKEEHFILDSAAPTIVLNSHYFESEESNETAQGVSGDLTMQNIEIDLFDWNGIRLQNAEIIGMDLRHLEEQSGKKFKGLIGFSVLKDYELFIDYKKSELSLFSEGNSKWHTEIKPETEYSFEYEAHIPIVKAIIKEKTYKFGLDTGASSNLLDLSKFGTLPKNSYREIAVNTLFGADQNETEVSVIEIKSCSISDKNFKNMEFAASDISHLNEGYGLDIDGLIGYPFLSDQKVSIDFLNQKIYFWK